MKLNEALEGSQVVTQYSLDAQVYTIKRIHAGCAVLVYPVGHHGIVSGGTVDISLLKKPSKEQLANYAKEL